MKKAIYFMSLLGTLLITSLMCISCGGGNDSIGDDPVTPTIEIKLRSASIDEGAIVKASQLSEIVLSYNNTVVVSSTANITLNKTKVQASVSRESALKIVISLGTLAEGTSYVLNVPEGSIISSKDSKATAAAYTLNFKTEEAPQVAITKELCNKNATKEAKNVYEYLLSQYGKKTLSASMANVNWNFAEAELVYQATGKYPAIAMMDYIHMLTLTDHNPFKGWKVNYDDISEVEKWWNNNGLLAASWHWNMPANEASIDKTDGYTCTPGTGTTGDKATTCAKPSNIMKEGTWEKKIADEDLKVMAELLKKLQDKNIPLIFRPFHEASGNTYGQYAGGGAWFWWGIEGADAYKKLWIYVYDYFKQAGINNLIWVWTSQNNGDADWYPGDEYVDIIGQDIYNQKADSNAKDFKRLQETFPNKMCTLSECGNVGKISEQWKQGATWSYFMPWYQYDAKTLDKHEHADTDWWKDAMSNKNVLSREDLPSLK